MRIKTLFALAYFIPLLSAFIGCTSKQAPLDLKGTKPFQFDWKKVTELTLVKSDPRTGDHWSASFGIDSSHAKSRKLGSHWKVLSAPDNQLIEDTYADENFVSHLLDSLRTLTMDDHAPHGPPESFGLTPPRFALKWTVSDPKQTFEFRLGDPIQNTGRAYLSINSETIEKPGNKDQVTHVYIASGAAIHLLEEIRSFQFMRKKQWSFLTPDDVDEIDIRYSGNNSGIDFYAQREGDQWTNHRRQPIHSFPTALALTWPSAQLGRISSDVSTFLETIFSLEPEEFIETPERKNKIQSYWKSSVLFQARFSGRLGKTSEIQLAEKSGKLYAKSSDRPEVILLLKASRSSSSRPPRTASKSI